ncbi:MULTISPECIES: DUF1272 domain-containing protein [unclassified Shewanella]|uniref:DUF1272 domain-containing protein n=2 Tax=unclassified Shewanella TaxID=196818 RepID=UPI001BC8051D|nr:hypothetical protein TUM4444_01900 [Shewanella sp. MBTL60-112-B1]GIU23957.1 hypothetical protein TUM4445_00470 [Shewanella sp. MBTL60-112-B2]
MLRMKTKCEHCHTALARKDTAYICSFEDTYCKRCSEKLHFTCVRCQGALVLRPPRLIKPFKVPTARLKTLALANSY